MKYLIKGIKVILIVAALFTIAIIFFFGHRDIPLNKLKAKYANTSSSFISMNGMDVHFHDKGD